MNIILVDSNDDFRSVIKIFIELELKYNVIADVHNIEDFLKIDSTLIRETDIVLVDILLNPSDDFEIIKKITYEHRHIKIIAITMYPERISLPQIIEVGFKGCLKKREVFTYLKKAIHELSHNRLFINEQFLDANFTC